jgi:hypothetical protein
MVTSASFVKEASAVLFRGTVLRKMGFAAVHVARMEKVKNP